MSPFNLSHVWASIDPECCAGTKRYDRVKSGIHRYSDLIWGKDFQFHFWVNTIQSCRSGHVFGSKVELTYPLSHWRWEGIYRAQRSVKLAQQIKKHSYAIQMTRDRETPREGNASRGGWWWMKKKKKKLSVVLDCCVYLQEAQETAKL